MEMKGKVIPEPYNNQSLLDLGFLTDHGCSGSCNLVKSEQQPVVTKSFLFFFNFLVKKKIAL
jgi:hypothetical protein